MTSLILPEKPAEPKQASPLAGKIRKLYDEGSRAIRPEQLQYRLNSSYIQGEQWVYKHSTRQEILRLPHDPRRVRATIPRVGPESRRIMARLLKRPLAYQVNPEAADEATIRAARVSEGVIQSVSDSHKWNKLREELAWGAWKGGTSALCLDWDTSAGTQLSWDPITRRPVGVGDIKETVLSIAEIATQPGTRNIELATYWIKAQALPSVEVKRTYGLQATPASDVSAATNPMQAKTRTGETPQNLSLVLTYYERPNPDNRKGQVLTVVGDQVVDGPKPWPFPFTDRLNLVACRETLIEGQWTGATVVSDAIPVQTALNASYTSILEHLKQAGNARMQGPETARDLAEGWTDDAAEFIFWRDQKFEWLSSPQQPAWWIDMPDRLAANMDDILGVHDISRGDAPANIQSGAGLAILAEQDDTPSGRFAQILADCFGDFATMVLQTYEAKVKPPERRKASLTNPGYVSEQINWSGDELLGQTRCIVPYDAVAPLNEAARYARLQFFVQAGMITSPRAASAYLDVPGMAGDFIEGIDPQVAKARRENYELMQGETCIPATFDDHAIHIEEHNTQRLSARYERSPDNIRQLIDTHVQAHSTMAAEEAAQQAMKAQYAPPLAAAAQASQPPGSAMPPGSSSPQATLGASMGGTPEAGPSGPPSDQPPGQLPPLGIPPLGV